MTGPTRIGHPDEPGLSGAAGPVITSGPALTAEDAARQLARDGWTLDGARALVRRYQDEATLRLGVPVHGWGLDGADLDAIRAAAPQAGAEDDARRAQLALWHANDGPFAAGAARERS